MEATNANVFVKANGRKSFPSAPVIVNTGRKPTTVVATAVSIALPTVSLGGVPAIGGDVAAKASESEAAQMQEVQSEAWAPADSMAFDKVVSPVDLRSEIIAVLQRD